MTTDEWHEISKLIEECDYYGLAEEIASRVYDLDISKQELDKVIRDYATKSKMKKESIHEIYLRCKRLVELKKFIAEHKEEIIGKQPLTDTPIVPDIYRVTPGKLIISWV